VPRALLGARGAAADAAAGAQVAYFYDPDIGNYYYGQGCAAAASPARIAGAAAAWCSAVGAR
jgi:hypothetical protein